MSESDDKKYDTRQLEKYRSREVPGEPRLRHFWGRPEQYVLSAWHVRVGHAIRAPQVIATIETDSFTLDFEAFDSGVLTEQCFAVGEAIPDGAVIARIAVSPEENTQ
jgi:hypothetical protein